MKENWECKDVEALRNRIVRATRPIRLAGACRRHQRLPWRRLESRRRGRNARGEDRIQAHRPLQPLGHARPERPRVSGPERAVFLPPQRVIGARGALVLLIQTLTYVDWHSRARECPHLQHHLDFADELGRRMQREGLRLDAECRTRRLRAGQLHRGGRERREHELGPGRVMGPDFGEPLPQPSFQRTARWASGLQDAALPRTRLLRGRAAGSTNPTPGTRSGSP